MKKTTLVILAAGMGSRYGSLKQIDPVGPCGEFIIDYSIYDALKVGFNKIVFVIKKSIEDDFKAAIGDRISKHIEVDYAYQELDKIPEGYTIPEGRVKPWGTGHAVMCCKGVVDTAFAVINADDFYGRDAFQKLHNFLISEHEGGLLPICMAGFELKNTLTENGFVSRGVCKTDTENYLIDIVERVRIEQKGASPAFTEDDGQSWETLSEDVIVSMNCWGFPESFLDCIEDKFKDFLEALGGNSSKAEFYLPMCVDLLIKEQTTNVSVLKTGSKWYGITYKDDKAGLMAALKDMADKNIYPERLWN